MAATRTHTKYFSGDSPGMEELRTAYFKLKSDYEQRKDHVSPKVRAAIERRLEMLRHAWTMLLEPVPSSYE